MPGTGGGGARGGQGERGGVLFVLITWQSHKLGCDGASLTGNSAINNMR